jgi:hypothetical protein
MLRGYRQRVVLPPAFCQRMFEQGKQIRAAAGDANREGLRNLFKNSGIRESDEVGTTPAITQLPRASVLGFEPNLTAMTGAGHGNQGHLSIR